MKIQMSFKRWMIHELIQKNCENLKQYDCRKILKNCVNLKQYDCLRILKNWVNWKQYDCRRIHLRPSWNVLNHLKGYRLVLHRGTLQELLCLVVHSIRKMHFESLMIHEKSYWMIHQRDCKNLMSHGMNCMSSMSHGRNCKSLMIHEKSCWMIRKKSCTSLMIHERIQKSCESWKQYGCRRIHLYLHFGSQMMKQVQSDILEGLWYVVVQSRMQMRLNFGNWMSYEKILMNSQHYVSLVAHLLLEEAYFLMEDEAYFLMEEEACFPIEEACFLENGKIPMRIDALTLDLWCERGHLF